MRRIRQARHACALCLQTGKVVLYNFKNYGSDWTLSPKELGVGAYPSLAQAGFAYNALSSIKVTPGCQAILYNSINFGGSSTIITADTADLATFDDAAESMVVSCAIKVG
jgi:hypothetical protein